MFWASLLFAALCVAYALFGFSSIDAGMPAEQQADSRGYAWFWTFLGAIGLLLAIVSWFMTRDPPDGRDE
jgi:bacteriorhodopsin